jgi:hypothetical protein
MRALDGRVLAALRAVYGAPAPETVDWWSLRRRIQEHAMTGGRARSLWDWTLWRRALIPMTCAAMIVMALAIADTRSTIATGFMRARADSTEMTAWLRAATAGNAVSPGDLDDVSGKVRGGQDAWLGAALTSNSD